MKKVKIKIVKTDTINEGQTEDLADCGFNHGDVVLAVLYADGGAVVESSDFDRALWDGSINLEAEEFEVVND